MSRHLVALIAACVAPALFLCANDRVLAASGRVSIEIGGSERSAVVVEPQRLKRGLRAAIVVLHGDGADGQGAQSSLGLDALVRDSGVVTLYPDLKGGDGDAAFVRALVAKLGDEGMIDRRRVFIAGIGAGGLLAERMACDSGGLLAGLGAIGAALPANEAASCQLQKPLPFLLIASAQGAREQAATTQMLAPFTKAAGCSGGSTMQTARQLGRSSAGATSPVTIERFSGCRAPITVIRGVIERRGGENDAGRLFWNFFRRAGA